VFVLAVALSYACTDQVSLAREIIYFGQKYTSLSQKQIFLYTSTARKKAAKFYQEKNDYLRGLTDKKPENHRYKLSVKEMLSRLEWIIPVWLYDQLRAIVPYQLKR